MLIDMTQCISVSSYVFYWGLCHQKDDLIKMELSFASRNSMDGCSLWEKFLEIAINEEVGR